MNEEHLSKIVQLRGTKAQIAAMTAAVTEAAWGYAEDTGELGLLTGGVWTWVEGSKGILSLLDAPGDLLVASAPDTLARLPVGAAGQVLAVDAGAANGLKWVDLDAGTNIFYAGRILQKLTVGVGGVASLEITDIPAGLDALEIIVEGLTTHTVNEDWLLMAFNGDLSTANYRDTQTAFGAWTLNKADSNRYLAEFATTKTIGSSAVLHTVIDNPSGSQQKVANTRSYFLKDGTNFMSTQISTFLWRQTAAITTISIKPASNALFAAGTKLTVIGYANRTIVAPTGSGTDRQIAMWDGTDNIVATGATIDAKGDLLVGAAADTLARLPVGTTGQVLTPNPAAAGGVAWVDPALTGAGVAGQVGVWSGTSNIAGSNMLTWDGAVLSAYKSVKPGAELHLGSFEAVPGSATQDAGAWINAPGWTEVAFTGGARYTRYASGNIYFTPSITVYSGVYTTSGNLVLHGRSDATAGVESTLMPILTCFGATGRVSIGPNRLNSPGARLGVRGDDINPIQEWLKSDGTMVAKIGATGALGLRKTTDVPALDANLAQIWFDDTTSTLKLKLPNSNTIKTITMT
jgi:hypothetical protein